MPRFGAQWVIKMYKELREYGSTSGVWANPFLKSSIPLIEELKIRSLKKDIRWQQIAKRLPSGAKVLDAGCGLGEWVIFMSEKGLRPCGLDYSQEIISFLKNRYPKQQWQQGIIQDLPFPSESFDAVISWGVIEHDGDGPQKALREFYRILKPGARLFVTVPVDSPAQRRSSTLVFDDPAKGIFFQYFIRPDELKSFLCQAGFEIELVMPASRHYALVFPRLYRNLTNISPLVSRVVGLLLKPVIVFRDEALNMILAVANKPKGNP
jgi:ubiquinone/menaquinone biosynthesis C-methylase UbiE